jgi:hypothetical protein
MAGMGAGAELNVTRNYNGEAAITLRRGKKELLLQAWAA